MPGQRTVSLSKAAVIELSVESIKMDVRINELVNAIILKTDWKEEVEDLRAAIMKSRAQRKEESDAN